MFTISFLHLDVVQITEFTCEKWRTFKNQACYSKDCELIKLARSTRASRFRYLCFVVVVVIVVVSVAGLVCKQKSWKQHLKVQIWTRNFDNSTICTEHILLKKMYRKVKWQFSRSVNIWGREMTHSFLDSPK